MSIFKRIQRIVSAEISDRLGAEGADQKSFEASDFSNDENPHQALTIEEQFYANLELCPGASFEEVKRSYKNLLKKYHPDRFHNDDRAKYAEEITQKLNEAYAYFENKEKEK